MPLRRSRAYSPSGRRLAPTNAIDASTTARSRRLNGPRVCESRATASWRRTSARQSRASDAVVALPLIQEPGRALRRRVHVRNRADADPSRESNRLTPNGTLDHVLEPVRRMCSCQGRTLPRVAQSDKIDSECLVTGKHMASDANFLQAVRIVNWAAISDGSLDVVRRKVRRAFGK